MHRTLFISLFILNFISGACFSQIVENFSNGKIDWQQRMITATGIGVPNKSLDPSVWEAGARKAAELDAMAKLLATTKGISINESHTVENFMRTNQEVTGQIQGVLRNFQIIATRKNPDGSVEVDVGVLIDGNLSNTFIPLQLEQKPPLNVPEPEKAKESEKLYTGLIVDARGLKIRPAMEPKIVNENGDEVYGEGYFLRDYAVAQGVAGYSKQLEKALESERVRDKPVVVKGIKSAGPRRTDVVISNADANMLHSSEPCLKFMLECKVIIVID